MLARASGRANVQLILRPFCQLILKMVEPNCESVFGKVQSLRQATASVVVLYSGPAQVVDQLRG